MSDELLAEGRKSRVFRLANGTIAKEVLHPKRVEREWKALNKLADLFPATQVDGWTYDVVRPQQLDREAGRIIMTEAKGKPVGELVCASPEVAWHAGVWIGIFHQTVEGDKGTVPSFRDFTHHHVYIDSGSKTVTTLDPGEATGKMVFPEEDLFLFVRSAAVRLRHRFPTTRRVITSFFAGYEHVRPHTWTAESLRRAALTVRARRLRRLRSSGVYKTGRWLLLESVHRILLVAIHRYLRWHLVKGRGKKSASS